MHFKVKLLIWHNYKEHLSVLRDSHESVLLRFKVHYKCTLNTIKHTIFSQGKLDWFVMFEKS